MPARVKSTYPAPDCTVLVYGTLKKGHGNHRLIEATDCRFLGPVCVRGYKLVDLGGFPGAVATGRNEDSVMAEAWRVPVTALEVLDRLEGYRGKGSSNFYTRLKVRSLPAPIHRGWMYTLPRDPYLRYPHITDGVWRGHGKNNHGASVTRIETARNTG